MANFIKNIIFFIFCFDILPSNGHSIQFFYNFRKIYRPKEEGKFDKEFKHELKENKIKVSDLKKICVEANNNDTYRNEIISEDNIIFLYLQDGHDYRVKSDGEDDNKELTIESNYTAECYFVERNKIQSIRGININSATINGTSITTESYNLNNLPIDVLKCDRLNWVENIGEWVVKNSKDLREFLDRKKYINKSYILYDGEEKICGDDLFRDASELEKSPNINIVIDGCFLKYININYKTEEGFSLREHSENDDYFVFEEDPNYGEAISLPKKIDYYYRETDTLENKKEFITKRLNSDVNKNEYETDDFLICDSYESAEVRERKMKNIKNCIELPEEVTWKNLGDEGTHINYILSEKSDAVKTKVMCFYLKKNGHEVSTEIKNNPIVIVLNDKDCDDDKTLKATIRKKLSERLFNGKKLSDETIEKLLNGEINTKDGAYNNYLTITDEEERNLLQQFYKNKESKDKSKKTKTNNNIPNSKCCLCYANCCCKGK